MPACTACPLHSPAAWKLKFCLPRCRLSAASRSWRGSGPAPARAWRARCGCAIDALARASLLALPAQFCSTVQALAGPAVHGHLCLPAYPALDPQSLPQGGLLGRVAARGGSAHGGRLFVRSPSSQQLALLARASERQRGSATVHGPGDYWRVMRQASELAAMGAHSPAFRTADQPAALLSWGS